MSTKEKARCWACGKPVAVRHDGCMAKHRVGGLVCSGSHDQPDDGDMIITPTPEADRAE